MSEYQYWESGEGLAHITPPGNWWPEGEEFKIYYPDIFFGQDVVEFGCGVGRLAPFFSKLRYRGVDISPKALAIAAKENPGYRFDLIDATGPIEGGYVLFAHNVLMHIPDDDLLGTVQRFTQSRIIVSEVLGRSWRRPGNPPVFNREIEEYERPFRASGYRLHRVMPKMAGNYRDAQGNAVEFFILEFHKQ